LVLNEPETSLHPDLLPALGRLIANAAEASQALVVTHAAKLIAALEEQKECNSVRLEKEFGETKVVGADSLDLPVWRWAAR
jgi:predicted ATPase